MSQLAASQRCRFLPSSLAFSTFENALKINKETLHLKQKKQAKPFKNKVRTELTVYTLKVMPSLNNNILIFKKIMMIKSQTHKQVNEKLQFLLEPLSE